MSELVGCRIYTLGEKVESLLVLILMFSSQATKWQLEHTRHAKIDAVKKGKLSPLSLQFQLIVVASKLPVAPTNRRKPATATAVAEAATAQANKKATTKQLMHVRV